MTLRGSLFYFKDPIGIQQSEKEQNDDNSYLQKASHTGVAAGNYKINWTFCKLISYCRSWQWWSDSDLVNWLEVVE